MDKQSKTNLLSLNYLCSYKYYENTYSMHIICIVGI